MYLLFKVDLLRTKIMLPSVFCYHKFPCKYYMSNTRYTCKIYHILCTLDKEVPKLQYLSSINLKSKIMKYIDHLVLIIIFFIHIIPLLFSISNTAVFVYKIAFAIEFTKHFMWIAGFYIWPLLLALYHEE